MFDTEIQHGICDPPHMSWTDSNTVVETFAIQPGSPRFPCIHSMHGVGCRLPVIELFTVGTWSPAVYDDAYVHMGGHGPVIPTDSGWLVVYGNTPMDMCDGTQYT